MPAHADLDAPGGGARRRSPMAARCPAAALLLALAACLACRSERAVESTPEVASTTPDRLTEEESLPESETAFGLPIPYGMRVTRHFKDAAYVAGHVPLDRALEQVRAHLDARDVQMMSRRVVFPRTRVKGSNSKRLLRVEVVETARGTQLLIKDITPPPTPQLATDTDAERWRRAGRNPDGTPIDQNTMY